MGYKVYGYETNVKNYSISVRYRSFNLFLCIFKYFDNFWQPRKCGILFFRINSKIWNKEISLNILIRKDVKRLSKIGMFWGFLEIKVIKVYDNVSGSCNIS